MKQMYLLRRYVLNQMMCIELWIVSITETVAMCCRDFTISYLATDDTGEDVYLSLLSDWDLDAAFFSASNPCLRLKVDLKPFEPGLINDFLETCLKKTPPIRSL